MLNTLQLKKDLRLSNTRLRKDKGIVQWWILQTSGSVSPILDNMKKFGPKTGARTPVWIRQWNWNSNLLKMSHESHPMGAEGEFPKIGWRQYSNFCGKNVPISAVKS